MGDFFYYKELHEYYVFHFVERRRVRLLKSLGPTAIKNCQNTVTIKKYDLFRKVESYFFIDLDQFVRIRDNWFDFKNSYERFPRFFSNLKCITESEIDNFLLFFGASSVIVSDQVFKRKVVFFFSNLHSDYCIFLLFLYHTVYEFYYLVSHKVTSVHFLIKLAELINQRLLIKFKVEDDRTFTVRVVGMTEYVYSLMYENVRVKVASYNSLKDQSFWLEFSRPKQSLKDSTKLLDEILTLYYSLFRIYLRFFFFIRKKAEFVANHNLSYAFLCKFFLRKNIGLSLLVFKKMNFFFQKVPNRDSSNYFKIQNFMETFTVFFLRFFRKFLLFFLKGFKNPKLFSLFSTLYLKLLQDITKRFVFAVQMLVNSAANYGNDIFVYSYIFRAFSFERFSGLSRFNFQLQKFPGADSFAANPLLIFSNLANAYGKLTRESSVYLTKLFRSPQVSIYYKLGVFLLFRFASISTLSKSKLVSCFLKFIVRFNFLFVFTPRTQYYYRFFFETADFGARLRVTPRVSVFNYIVESYLNVKIGLFFFFSGLANYFKEPAFYMVFRTMDFPKFEYVPIPLRVSSVIYDLFSITSEDNMIEDEDTQLELYEDYLADFEEEQPDEADEDPDDWYWIYYTEDFEEAEPTFFLLDEHLHINLHSNVLLKRKYSDDALPLLAGNVVPESLVEQYSTPQRPFRVSYWSFLEDFFKYLYHEQHILKSEYMLFFTDLWIDGVEDLRKFDKYFSYNSTKQFVEESEREDLNFFWSFDNKFKDFYDLAQEELDDYFSKRILAYNIETRQWTRFWFNFIQTARFTTQGLLSEVLYWIFEPSYWAQYKNLYFNDRYTLLPYVGYSTFDAYPEINEPALLLSQEVLVSAYLRRPIEGFRVFNMLSFYRLSEMFLGVNYFADLFDPKYLFREGLNVSSSVIEDYFSDVYSTFVNRYVHSDIEPHLDVDYYEKFFDLSSDDYFNYGEHKLDVNDINSYMKYYETLEPGDDNNDIDDFEDEESAVFGEGSLVEQRGVDLEKDDPSLSFGINLKKSDIHFSIETGETFGVNAINYKSVKDRGFVSLLRLRNFFVAEGLSDYRFRLKNMYFEKNHLSVPLCSKSKGLHKFKIFSPTLRLFNSLTIKTKFLLDENGEAGGARDSNFALSGFQITGNSAILHTFGMKSAMSENVHGFFFLNELNQTISDQKYRIFYKFITIFMCRREDLSFLKGREPKIIFLLRFLLFSIVARVYKFFKKIDLFNFFIYLLPAFFFFVIVNTFKKVYQLNDIFDQNLLCNYRTHNTQKFEAFYAAFCTFGADLKKLKVFFRAVLFRVDIFVKEYIVSFSSYESRDVFFRKYGFLISRLIRNLTGMCSMLFFRKSTVFFGQDKINVYGAVKASNLRGDFFSKIYSLSLSPTLRSYVSTLLDYSTDEKTFFSKLSDKDFLRWVRRGYSKTYEEGLHDHTEVLMDLKTLRGRLVGQIDLTQNNYVKKLRDMNIAAFQLSLNMQDYDFFESTLSGKQKYMKKSSSLNLNRSLEIETYLTDFEDFETEDLDINDDWDEEQDGDEDRFEDESAITFDEHELLGDADQRNFEDPEYREAYLYDDYFYEVDVNTLPSSFEDGKTYMTWFGFEQLSQQSVKFRKNKIFYLFFLAQTFGNTLRVVFRDYVIAFYRYYLDHATRIKDFTIRFDKILDFINLHKKAKLSEPSFMGDFNVRYTRNNAILQSYVQRNLLNDLDNYLQPEYDYEEFDFVYSDIHNVTNNVSEFRHILFDNINKRAHFDYFLLNFTFLESQRVKVRLIKMLYNEFHASPTDDFFTKKKLTPATSIDLRFFWLEAETLMIRRIFGFYYSGFFFKQCNLKNLVFSTRGSFRLLKFVLLRVRFFFLEKLKKKVLFLKNLRELNTLQARCDYLCNYFFKHSIKLTIAEINLLVNYTQFLDANNQYFSALDIFDLYRLLKMASFLKYKFRTALTSFGYILLVQELIWLRWIMPNLSKIEFSKKFFEYFKCLRAEELFFYKNYYSLFQLYSKYGINEAHYYLESNIKYFEIKTFLIASVPKTVQVYHFFRDLFVLLIFFFIIIFLCSDYNGFTIFSETYFNNELEYEDEPYEETFENRLTLFSETTRARKREFITEFYDYFMRLW